MNDSTSVQTAEFIGGHSQIGYVLRKKVAGRGKEYGERTHENQAQGDKSQQRTTISHQRREKSGVLVD